MDYVTRSIEAPLREAAAFPVIELTGPRQAGKTTTLRHVFRDTHDYVSLDEIDTLSHAREDPRDFLRVHPAPVIIDEFQRAPDLAGYIKVQADADPDMRAGFVLTGSQNLGVSRAVTESLAGRAAILRLFPLTAAELRGEPDAPLPWEPSLVAREPVRASIAEAWEAFLRGYFPRPALDQRLPLDTWMRSYLSTYIERDVRELRSIGDLSAFRAFVSLAAARAGQALDIAALGADASVSPGTARAWLSVLEASYQVILLRPYSGNLRKRMVKRPKLYFTDVGLLCHLVGLRTVEHALRGPMAGAIVENAVVAEVFKRYEHRGVSAPISHWRTHAGAEVDLVVETPDGAVPVEIKSAGTAHPRMAAGIRRFRADIGADRTQPGYVVHPGEVVTGLEEGATAIPFREL